jgi:hypothetical protein
MRPSFITQIVLALCVGISLDCRASRPDEDHLVPLKEAYGLSAVYHQVWERQLLVTPGNVARFVSLPGTGDVETAISIYRKSGENGSLRGSDYWVTVTQASESLWRAVESKTDPTTIRVQRCDTPISESTAVAVHKAWMAMLAQTKAQQKSGISVDSSQEIFSAAKPDGAILEAESPLTPKQNTKALIDIALSFMEYCDAPVAKRAQITSKIEKAVSKLLARVESGKQRH